MEARTHSRFGGSIAKRYMACPGSVALCETVPAPPPSKYAAEGTAAHELAALCLAKDERPVSHLGETIEGFVVDQPMCDAVVEYLNVVAHEIAQTRDAEFYVEHSFTLPLSAAAPGEVHGTVDCLVYHPAAGRMVVFDYKHGQGVSVDVEGNEQLQFYAAGALLSNPTWKVREIECVIVQPRALDAETAGAVKRWTVDILGLYGFIERLNEAVAEAKAVRLGVEGASDAGVQWFHPGDHCRWCPAASACPAREQQFLEVAQLGYADVRDIEAAKLPDPRQYDTEQLGRLLKAFDILDGWAQQVREYASALAMAGTPIPYHKLVPTQARAKIVGTPEEVSTFLAMFYGVPLDESMPRKLATLTDLEKALRGRLSGEALTAAKADLRTRYTTRESSGLVLVPATDKREAVNLADAHYATANLEGLQS